MRHGIAGNKLSRNQELRKVTVRDLAKATLIEERICTTKAKAKEARKLVDKLITLGKNGQLADKRRAFAILCDHQLVSDLFNKTSPRFKNRIGGYTRIILLGTRRGDNAQLVLLELTEKTEVVISKQKTKDKKDIIEAKATEVKPEPKVIKVEPKEPLQDPHPPKDAVKAQADKAKASRKIMSGLRKMFNRKTGAS